MSSNELETSVADIRTDVRTLRANMDEMGARIAEMWLADVERKAMWQALRIFAGSVLVGLTISCIIVAIVQALR